MSSLWDYTQSLGVKILTSTEVESLNDEGQTVAIQTKDIMFKAKKAIVCTNAFTKNLFPELEITPGRGQVLITKPIPNLPFKGVFHMDEGFYYFRNFEDRVLFGGGRNLDFEGEATTSFDLNHEILNTLKEKLKSIIIPQFDFEIEHEWTGIMAFGNTKTPIIKKYSPNIHLGVRLNGMGVAIGSELGNNLSELVSTEI